MTTRTIELAVAYAVSMESGSERQGLLTPSVVAAARVVDGVMETVDAASPSELPEWVKRSKHGATPPKKLDGRWNAAHRTKGKSPFSRRGWLSRRFSLMFESDDSHLLENHHHWSQLAAGWRRLVGKDAKRDTAGGETISVAEVSSTSHAGQYLPAV